MRIRLPLGRSLFFLSAFLVSLVALLPLGLALEWLALDARGLAAREAEGSVWIGALKEAQLGPVALGDLDAGLRALPLLIGRARVDVERSGAADRLEGGVTVSRHVFGLDDFSAGLAVGTLFAPLPLAALDLADVSVHFANGLCASADGLVKASLAAEAGGAMLPRSLSGDARCDGGALLLPLVSQAGTERLSLRLYEDGRYRAELLLRALDEPTRQRLAAAGFALAPGGYVLRAEGKF
jgi:general secretion pathway protein N